MSWGAVRLAAALSIGLAFGYVPTADAADAKKDAPPAKPESAPPAGKPAAEEDEYGPPPETAAGRMRRLRAEAIGRRGAAATDAEVSELIALFADSEDWVGDAAYAALVRCGARSVPALMSLIDKPGPN